LAIKHDAIVIGAGHNALVCAAYLARGGLKVLVLESRDEIGGATRTFELWPGVKVSRYSYMVSLLQSKIINELDLRSHGYRLLPNDGLFTPFEDGSHIMLWNEVSRTAAEIGRFSAADAKIYPEFDAKLNVVANTFRRLLWLTPPTLSPLSVRSAADLLALARELRLSGEGIYDLIDIMTMSVKDYVDDWFESDEIKAVLSYYSGIGHFAGPMSQGTAYVLLHHLMGEGASAGGWGFVEGGMGTVSRTIAAAATQRGVEIRSSAPVRRILVDKAWNSKRARSSRRAPWYPAPMPRRPSSSSCRRKHCLRSSCATSVPTAPSRPHSARTWCCGGCQRMRLLMQLRQAWCTRPICMWRRVSSIWSAPTMMRSMAASHGVPTSPRWCPRSRIQPWHPRASTSSTSSAAMRPMP
jgi:hypothetical protein